MAITLTNGFELIPEGKQVLKVISVDSSKYNDFGKLVYTLSDAKGRTMTERFSLTDNNGLPNPKAIGAFSFFAKVVMGNMDLEKVEADDLVGHYFKCEVVHNKVESNTKPGTYNTFANLGREKEFATGFEGQPSSNSATSEPVTESIPLKEQKPKFDLDSILG